MAHFAYINTQGIVEQVIVAEQDVIDSGMFGNPLRWVQTSYNTYGGIHKLGGTPLRKNYAGIGFIYDSIRDAFIPPKPYESWVLNTTTADWESPIGPQPERTQEDIDANLSYFWIEETQDWRLSTLMQMIQQDLKS